MEANIDIKATEEEDGSYLTETAWHKVLDVNSALAYLRYVVRVYDARPIIDYVKISLLTKNDEQFAMFPIEIKRKPVPLLTFRNTNTIADKITIVTKVRKLYSKKYQAF